MQTEMSVEIDRPIEKVFDYTTNHVAEWSQTVVEEEILKETPEVVGTTFRIVTEEKGNRMDFQGVVVRHEPPHASAIQLTGPQFDIDVWYLFEDVSGRTRVTQKSIVKGKGLVKVMFFLFGWMMAGAGRKSIQQELNNLKRLLEAPAEESTT